MNKKIIIVALLLTPIVYCAEESQELRQLKTKQSAIEAALVQCRDKMEQEFNTYHEYMNKYSLAWQAKDEQYKEMSQRIHEELYIVIKEGRDLAQFFEEQAPWLNEGSQVLTVLVAYQFLRVADAVDEFVVCLNDFLKVNREIYDLEQSSN